MYSFYLFIHIFCLFYQFYQFCIRTMSLIMLVKNPCTYLISEIFLILKFLFLLFSLSCCFNSCISGPECHVSARILTWMDLWVLVQLYRYNALFLNCFHLAFFSNRFHFICKLLNLVFPLFLDLPLILLCLPLHIQDNWCWISTTSSWDTITAPLIHDFFFY